MVQQVLKQTAQGLWEIAPGEVVVNPTFEVMPITNFFLDLHRHEYSGLLIFVYGWHFPLTQKGQAFVPESWLCPNTICFLSLVKT
jgi:hypothetical protein